MLVEGVISEMVNAVELSSEIVVVERAVDDTASSMALVFSCELLDCGPTDATDAFITALSVVLALSVPILVDPVEIDSEDESSTDVISSGTNTDPVVEDVLLTSVAAEYSVELLRDVDDKIG